MLIRTFSTAEYFAIVRNCAVAGFAIPCCSSTLSYDIDVETTFHCIPAESRSNIPSLNLYKEGDSNLYAVTDVEFLDINILHGSHP